MALELDENNTSALYYFACLESKKSNEEKSLEYLKKAIEINEEIKKLAKNDPDFNNIKDSNEFKKLIN